MKIKRLFLILLLIITCGMGYQDKPRVILFGDSITQAGVQTGGYIDLLTKMDSGTEYIGAGIGGNKVYDLYLRLEKHVLSRNPDVVVIYIGVNDVWHKQTLQTGTDADKFTLFYQALIDKMKAAGIRVIICTPAVIGEKTDFSNPQDGDLNKYSNLIRQLAVTNKCELVDLRKTFLKFNLENNLQNLESGILTTDRVHLNPKGNEIVAKLILQQLKTPKKNPE